MHIYITNLNLQFGNDDLRKLFEPFGEVAAAEIAVDGFTNKSRGFGHVEMTDDESAQKAIQELNGKEISGQAVKVEETEAKVERKGSYKVGNGAVNVYRFRKK